ncbi:hypothetical protein GGX14DRAFT_570839 [Mycena pura]|uniref:Uncharacterized protein n=1 Tax=Mycena pura TaxID=153505 RepID=A0AAD6V498_9AGAR|nr:hypothetical protein GGX14DRAFT_570839 [Mycena pura]
MTQTCADLCQQALPTWDRQIWPDRGRSPADVAPTAVRMGLPTPSAEVQVGNAGDHCVCPAIFLLYHSAILLSFGSLAAATIGGPVGSMFAAQSAETGETRIVYQQFPANDLVMVNMTGSFATADDTSVHAVAILGSTVFPGTPLAGYNLGPGLSSWGFYYLDANLTVTEFYVTGESGGGTVHHGTGNACPDCIENWAFTASPNTIGMYVIATADGARRIGLLSPDQDAIVEIDRAAAGEPYVFARLPPQNESTTG